MTDLKISVSKIHTKRIRINKVEIETKTKEKKKRLK